MEVIDNKAIKLTVSEQVALRITAHIEKSKIIHSHEGNDLVDVLVNWGIAEMTTLNQCVKFKTPLPSPISKKYDWPGLYKPFDHQRITSEFLTINPKAFCFNEAGTGKTSSVLWSADYLMNLGLVKRVLVICPLSIMQSAWQNDIFNTCMHRTSAVCHGPAHKRKTIIEGTYDFVIINYDGVGIIRKEIKDANFDLIVIDEANAYKSTSTTRWKIISKIITANTRLWMLTGTPASQSPMDAYGIAKLVAPERVPKFTNAWRDRVMHQVSRFKWIPRPDSKHKVFDVLQPAIRFAKNDCLDLPDVMYQTREVPLTPQALSYYRALKTEMLIETGGESVTAVNAAAGMNKLLQISGGAVYTDERKVIEFDISPRLNALMETIDETEHKILIFVPYRHTISIVQNHLTKNNITSGLIHGDVTANERATLINRFQTSDNPRVLVVQPQSASHGVTLTKANVVVFWSPVMSVEVYLQCIARIDRVGQINKMTVVHLQGSDVEKRMYGMLQGKVDSHIKLVDLYREELENGS